MHHVNDKHRERVSEKVPTGKATPLTATLTLSDRSNAASEAERLHGAF